VYISASTSPDTNDIAQQDSGLDALYTELQQVGGYCTIENLHRISVIYGNSSINYFICNNCFHIFLHVASSLSDHFINIISALFFSFLSYFGSLIIKSIIYLVIFADCNYRPLTKMHEFYLGQTGKYSGFAIFSTRDFSRKIFESFSITISFTDILSNNKSLLTYH
jgi:hypothetical protein